MQGIVRTISEMCIGKWLYTVGLTIQNCLKQLHPDGDLGEFIANPDLQYNDDFFEEKK